MNEKNLNKKKEGQKWRKTRNARLQMKTMLMRIAVDVANEVAVATAADGGSMVVGCGLGGGVTTAFSKDSAWN